MDEQDHILSSIVLIIAQILQYGMSSILDFASFLAEEIHNGFIRIEKDEETHNGLIGIAKAKVDKPFCWYSMLMYI